MAAEQYCLKWNNHQSTLLVNFETLLESNVLTDCTLSADGKYLNVHRVVLSACSPYFYKLLGEHRDKHPIFFMKDTSYDELKGIVDYMYKGEVNIDQDKIESFLSTAKSLQIKGLADEDGGSAAKEDDEGLPRSKRKPPDLVDSPLPDESPRSPKRKRRPRPPSQDSAQDQNNHCDIPPVTYQPPPPPAPQPEITMPTPMMPVKKTEPIETHSGFSQVQLKTEQIEEPQDDVQDLTLDDDEEEYGAGDESQQAGTSFSESSQDMKWFQQMTNQSVMSDDSFMASASTQNVTNNTGTPGSQGRRFMCPSCYRSYKRIGALRAHQRIECGKLPRIKCPYCVYRTKHKKAMKSHVGIKHPEYFQEFINQYPVLDMTVPD